MSIRQHWPTFNQVSESNQSITFDIYWNSLLINSSRPVCWFDNFTLANVPSLQESWYNIIARRSDWKHNCTWELVKKIFVVDGRIRLRLGISEVIAWAYIEIDPIVVATLLVVIRSVPRENLQESRKVPRLWWVICILTYLQQWIKPAVKLHRYPWHATYIDRIGI